MFIMQCPHCATIWPDEMAGVLKFCGACGKPMDSVPLAEAGLLHEVATSDPGGELRYMTVVFADLAGFTAFSEDHAPDEVARIVGDLLQRLAQLVALHNGAVDKFLGDAIVATFGLQADSNASRNAVRAGLAMQEETVRFNTENGFNFGLRVGIHAGQAMFRAIGGSWTVMGDTVNTASRLQSATAQGKVWISQPVYDEVRRYFNVALRPAVEIKGKKQVIQPYEVFSERTTPQIELPPFVGREQEWGKIQALLDECLQSDVTRIALIRGAAGVGKSRLTWELREWAQHRQDQLFRLDVIQYDHSERLPSHGLNTLIRNRFQLSLELNEESILDQLARRLPEEYPDAPKGRETIAVEFFAFVLGILRSDFQIASMDGAGKWRNAFLEIKSWLESQARREPWIIILEDAQKGDADTAAFFNWALTMEWNAPIFVVVTVREEDFGPECYWHQPITHWVNDGLVEEIRLREIQPKILAQALTPLGDGLISESMALRIAEHTEGNPLFATELALLIKDQGISEPEKMPLPGSIREVMEARLERLGTAGKEVAKRGALMGRRFTMDAVGRIWERPDLELHSGVRVLQETETIYEEASKLFAGEMEKVFRHGRLHEAALARIPKEERLRWLAGLENWAKTKLESFGEYWEGAGIMLVPLIARSRIEHSDLNEASLWYEALGWLHKKNHRSLEAAAAFRDALDCAAGLRRPVLQRQIAELESFSGELERARHTVETALSENADGSLPTPEIPARFVKLVDDPLAHWDHITLPAARLALRLAHAEALSRLGEVKEAEAAYETAHAELDSLTDATADILRLRWTNQWGYFLAEIRGDPHAAEIVYNNLRANIAINSPVLKSERSAFIGTEFNIQMRLGRFDRACVLAEEMLQLAQLNRNTRDEARAWNSMGITLISLGEWDESAKCYERCLSLARTIGERRLEAISLHNLGQTYVDQSRYAEARECQENYLALSRATGNHMAESYAPSTLAAIAIAQGDFPRAEHFIEQSLIAAEKNDWRRLIHWNRALSAQLKFYRWLYNRDAQLQESITAFSAGEADWKQLDEAGEYYAVLAIATFAAEGAQAARAVLERAHASVDESWTVARIFLELAETIIERKPVTELARHFRAKGFARGAAFAERCAQALA
jgi:class 3 adenylate cyclase/tetratricopeptide (TPR) repeat protein